jgi:hypothetical protein
MKAHFSPASRSWRMAGAAGQSDRRFRIFLSARMRLSPDIS